MSTLSRYLLREILMPLCILCALTVVVGATAQLLRAASEVSGIGIPMSALVRALPLAIPSLFGMGMPVAFVLALLVAFGRMAEERELLALAASGLSMRRLLLVPLITGVFLTGLGLLMTLWMEPRAIAQLREMLADAAAGYFGEALEPGVLHDQVPLVTIYFRSKEVGSGKLREIVLIDERNNSQPRLFIADHGRIDKKDGALRFVLASGEVHIGHPTDDAYRRVRFEELVWRVEPGPLIRKVTQQIPSVNSLPLDELIAAAYDPSKEPREHVQYMTTLQRKFTFPLANLVFVLLAFPVTTIFNRNSRFVVYAAVAMLTALYFTATQAIDPLLRLGLSAEAAAWAPNLLFGSIGLMMTLLRLRR